MGWMEGLLVGAEAELKMVWMGGLLVGAEAELKMGWMEGLHVGAEAQADREILEKLAHRRFAAGEHCQGTAAKIDGSVTSAEDQKSAVKSLDFETAATAEIQQKRR